MADGAAPPADADAARLLQRLAAPDAILEVDILMVLAQYFRQGRSPQQVCSPRPADHGRAPPR